jgi:peptidoglycan/LPS O-acetylase OafA/YrhL
VFYNYNFKVPTILSYGNLGVQLFFIISGFVITLTLSKSKTFMEFMKKRVVRLLPGMMICATATYLFFWAFDINNLKPACASIYNLLFSYTFLSPKFINSIFGTHFQYMDGVYWSIWAELQFYVIGGIIYFLSPKNFLRNYLILVVITVPLSFLFRLENFTGPMEALVGPGIHLKGRSLFWIFNLFQHNCWFLAGIVLNKMYFSKQHDAKLIFLFAGIFLVQMILLSDLYITAISTVFFIIFLLFLYKPGYLSFLSNKTLSQIGVASYSIYLIHQNIGFLIMNRIGTSLQDWNWIIPIFLIALSTAFGLLSYKYLEYPFSDKLKRLFFGRFRKPLVPEPAIATLP